MHSWWQRTNGVIALECAFGGRLDVATLTRAAELLVDTEPILGFMLVEDAPAPHWRRVPASERRLVTLVRTRTEYERLRRSGMDAGAGVQLALCLWRGEAADRLLVKMTHAAGDGASLQLLARRLASLYSELTLDPSYRPSRGRLRTRDPSELLEPVPRLARLQALLAFALFMAPRLFPRATHRLPLPGVCAGAWAPVVRRLSDPSLSSLSRYAKARGATVNDVVLAAAYRALAAAGWDGVSALRIPTTVDLRRWCLPPEHAAAVANISSWEFPYLMRDLGRTLDETTARVTALMRRRKRSRPGLAIGLIMLRAANKAADPAGARAFKSVSVRPRPAQPLLTLSNEGLLDKSALRFGDEAPLSAHVLPPFMRLPRLHVCVSGYDGALTVAAVTPENGRADVTRFLDTLLDELRVVEEEHTAASTAL